MSWFSNLGDTLLDFAPLAAKVVGGPYAAIGVSLLQGIFGDDEATPEQLAKQIKHATPEQLIALRGLDNQLQVQMKELGIKEDELVFKDRANARELFKQNIWPQILLSALFVVGYFVVTGLLTYYAVNFNPEQQINQLLFGALGTVLGVLTAAIPQILNFWFGSSRGSQEKNQMFAHQRNQQKQQQGRTPD